MNLSGFWSGQFYYPQEAAPPVKFDCEIIQTGSHISGNTTEIAELKSVPHFLIAAKIEGSFVNKKISFLKTYLTNDENYTTVEYDGTVNLLGNKIKGIWMRYDWSGTFIMIKDKNNQKAKTTISVANDTNI